MKLIGIDLGGTKIRGVLINSNGNVIKEKEIFVENNFKKDLEKLVSIIKEFDYKDIDGIGVGVPGLLDNKREKVVNFPNLSGWENFNLKKYLEKEFKKKVRLENDANCVALAEKKFGNGKNYSNFIVLTLGTGVGGGIIINDKLYIGKGNAGEIGYIKVGGMEKCFYNQIGCFESLANGSAIIRMTKESKINVRDPIELAKLAKQGNNKAINVFNKFGENLGKGIVNLIFTLDPEIILIGGGISKNGKLILSPAREYIEKNINYKVNLKIVKFVKYGGAIGAACLFLN